MCCLTSSSPSMTLSEFNKFLVRKPPNKKGKGAAPEPGFGTGTGGTTSKFLCECLGLVENTIISTKKLKSKEPLPNSSQEYRHSPDFAVSSLGLKHAEFLNS